MMLCLALTLAFVCSAAALKCPFDQTCLDNVQRCYSANITGTFPSSSLSPTGGCVSSSVCPVGGQLFSLTTAGFKVQANVSCCDSNQCNAPSAPIWSNGTLKCCADTACRSTLTCNTGETICVQIQSGSLSASQTVRGCATDNMCNATVLQDIFKLSNNTSCQRVSGASTVLSIWWFHFLLAIFMFAIF